MGIFIVQSNMINERIRGAFIMAKGCGSQMNEPKIKSEIYRDTCVMLDEKQNVTMTAAR